MYLSLIHISFDFALADLGVSSMQIDNPERGFSYKHEGPLDLRLNPEKGIPASERLRDITREELEGMLAENADEPYAAQISRAVLSEIRKGKDIATTTQLREIIEMCIRDRWEPGFRNCSARLVMYPPART